MEVLALASNQSRQTETCVGRLAGSTCTKSVLAEGAEEITNLIQWSKWRYSNMMWNLKSITRYKRRYYHPLHRDLTPDVLTCVLPLGTVSREVDSAHLPLTLIQFQSACHLFFSPHKCLHTQLNHLTFINT